MEKNCFVNFFDDSRSKKILNDSRDMMLEEKAIMLLFIIGHNIHRVMVDCFQYSTKTISYYFKEVLKVIY